MLSGHRGGIRERVSAPLLLVGVVILNYAWTTGFGFVNDDYIWIAGIRFPDRGSWLRATVVSPVFSRTWVRPVVELSFFANYLIGGMQPFTYHLVNVILYAVNVALVGKLATVLLESPSAGLAAGLLFAIHAAHPDAVTWISGRTELLAGALVLSALLLHLRDRWVLAGMTFGIALLAKESAICFPLLALIVDRLGPHRRGRLTVIAAYAALLLPYTWLRQATTGFLTLGVTGFWLLARGSVPEVLWNAAHQWVHLMGFLVTPLPVSGRVATVVVFVLCGVELWLANERERRSVWLAAAWVVAASMPVLGLQWVNARYVYLPSIGWSLLVVLLGKVAWARVPAQRRWRLAVQSVAGIWIVASLAAVQWSNELLRRNGIMSQRVIDAIVQVVPHPTPGTLFIVEGLGPVFLGATPSIRQPVLMFGLPEALRMRFDDPRLDATFPEVRAPQPADQGRPIVRLRWIDETSSFTR